MTQATTSSAARRLGSTSRPLRSVLSFSLAHRNARVRGLCSPLYYRLEHRFWDELLMWLWVF